jgi:hypothetical protein
MKDIVGHKNISKNLCQEFKMFSLHILNLPNLIVLVNNKNKSKMLLEEIINNAVLWVLLLFSYYKRRKYM